MCKIPGMSKKLHDAWEGPFRVIAVLGPVNYRVKEVYGKERVKVIHINNAKVYVEREKEVCLLTVVAEDRELDEGKVMLSGSVGEQDRKRIDEVLKEFEDLLDGSDGRFTGGEMTIELEQKRSDTLQDSIKQQLDDLQAEKIEPSGAAWASPMVPVPKPDGTTRLCIDYRKLNALTPQIQCPMRQLDEILGQVGRATVLSKLDLKSSFHQIPVAISSRDYTTFISPRGKYRFTVMPFGLKNAPAIFQTIMDNTLRPCNQFAVVYIDDVLIFSNSIEDHLEHIRQTLTALREAGLKVKPQKCDWGKRTLQYLGHQVGDGKVAVPTHRVTAIAEYKQPITKNDLQRFLGVAGYYRQFVPGYCNFSAKLTPATKPRASGKVQWTGEMLKAFTSLRSALSNFCILNVPLASDQFLLHTDASGLGVGCVLNVCRDGEILPAAFYSRQLRGAEVRYSTTKLEVLVVVESIKHFLHYLYDRKFTVITDHKPLTSLMTSKTLNRSLHGIALKLMEHDMVIESRYGTENQNADGLSCHTWRWTQGPRKMLW